MTEIALPRFGWTAIAARALSMVAAASGNWWLRSRGTPTLKACDSKKRERVALERALARAAGTWGGYMAAPPAKWIGVGQNNRPN
jgi:hypothetical protein